MPWQYAIAGTLADAARLLAVTVVNLRRCGEAGLHEVSRDRLHIGITVRYARGLERACPGRNTATRRA